MPVKKRDIPNIPIYKGDDRELRAILDKVRQAVDHIVNTDLVTEKDIHCKSLYVDDDSLYIGGVKFSKPDDSQDGHFLKFNKITKSFEMSNQENISIPKYTSDPDPDITTIYFNTADEELRIYDGSVWRPAMGRARAGTG